MLANISKKVISVLLCVVFLLPALSPFAVAEDNGEEAPEMMVNTGFEDVEAGIPAGWHAYKGVEDSGFADGWNNQFVGVEQNVVYEGQYSILIEKPEDRADVPWCRQYITDFTPGALYEVSAMVNYNTKMGASFMILAEFYSGDIPDDPATYIGGKGVGHVSGNSNDKWHETSGVFEVPENCKLLVIYMYLTIAGKVYVDDVSLKMSGGPEPYYATTDQAFYYPDDTEGKAYVEINSYYKSTDEPYSATVDFEFLDGDKVLLSQRNVKFENSNRVEFIYSMSLLSEMEKMYNVRMVLKGADGKVINTYLCEVYMYKRPTHVRSDGVYIDNDGNPFYPVFGYWPLDDYAKNKEIGVNVLEIGVDTNIENALRILDKAQEAGVKALVSLFYGPAGYPAGKSGNIAWVEEMVRAVKDHPAVFAYAPSDEPFGMAITEEARRWAIDAYRAIRGIDKDHPIYTVDFNSAHYKESQKYCDVWALDPYARDDTSFVSTSGKMGVEAAAGRKPTYVMAMTFKGDNHGLTNIQDVRGSLYRGFEAGAVGVGYFCIAKAIGSFTSESPVDLPDTPLWEPLTKFAKDELGNLFDYFSGKKYETFNKQDDGDVHSLYYESWVKDGDIWMIVHNRGNDKINAVVPLESNNGLIKANGAYAAAIGGTSDDIKISEGVLELEIGSQQVNLYKITPDSPLDFSNLSIPAVKPAGSDAGGINLFSDLNGYEWASTEINALDRLGILNETTIYTYSPGNFISRGDFAAALVRTLKLTANASDNFSDIDENAVYANEVAIGKALGILQGVGTNEFDPGGAIRRQDLMVIAARAMRMANKLPQTSALDFLSGFADSADIADYAANDVAAMVAAGVVAGSQDDSINPLGYTTRAEAAVIMYRILNTKELPQEERPTEPDDEVMFEDEELSETETAARENAIEFLSKLGIINITNPDGGFTRGEAAKAIAASLGCSELGNSPTPFSDVPESNKNSGYISILSTTKIMAGYEDNTFRPDEAVTYNQLLISLVKALGYGDNAEAGGGYPMGYLMYASQLGLTTGTPPVGDEPVRASIAALLIRHVLETKIVKNALYNPDVQLHDDSDGTMLSKYLQIRKYTGQITGVRMAVLESPRPLNDGEIAMGDIVFNTGKSGAEAFFGQKVNAYIKEQKDAPNELILFVEGRKSMPALILESDDILSVNSTGTLIRYTDKELKELSAAIDKDAVLIYNGKVKENWTVSDLQPELGHVTLVSQNRAAYDTIIIKEYTNHIIDSVKNLDDKLIFKDGESLSVELNNSSVKTSFVNMAGRSVKLSDCSSDNVLSVAKSEDGSIMELILSTQKMTGEISEVEENKVIINKKTYKIANPLKDVLAGAAYEGERLAPGLNATYYLDFSGRIAALDTSTVRPEYGYFTAMGKDESTLSEEVTVRIFTASGKMEYYELAKKVVFNGESKSARKAYESAELWENGLVKAQLVIYELNDEGKIRLIKTAKDSSTMSKEERLREFTIDDRTSDQRPELDRWVAYDQNSFGDYYRYDSSTVIFLVPDSYQDEKKYSIVDKSGWTDSGRITTPATFYDIDEDLVISAIVSVVAGEAHIAPNWAADIAVVTDVSKFVNNDGELVTGIKIYDKSGNKAVIPVDDDLQIYLGNQAITNPNTETEAIRKGGFGGVTITIKDFITVDKLKPGDVIIYELNPLSGMAQAIRVLLRASSPPANGIELSTNSTYRHYNFSDCTRAYAEVKEIVKSGPILAVHNDYDRLYVWRGRSSLVCPIILYEKDNTRNPFITITPQDVMVGDKVFVAASSVWNRMFVVYR